MIKGMSGAFAGEKKNLTFGKGLSLHRRTALLYHATIEDNLYTAELQKAD